MQLTDFGWATTFNPASPPRDHSGTFEFMAPEVLAERPCDFKVDAWGCGFVLYEMLSFTQPFDYRDQEQYRQAVLNK